MNFKSIISYMKHYTITNMANKKSKYRLTENQNTVSAYDMQPYILGQDLKEGQSILDPLFVSQKKKESAGVKEANVEQAVSAHDKSAVWRLYKVHSYFYNQYSLLICKFNLPQSSQFLNDGCQPLISHGLSICWSIIKLHVAKSVSHQ